ncbi:MAG: CRISPR-associated endonuclease Cas6 [Bacteroidota bacterium]
MNQATPTLSSNHSTDYTTISFPGLQLKTRDGHKVRGYFGRLFQEQSPLLHNHFDDGSPLYRYPMVQYKVVNRTAHLIGIKQGSQLLNELFFKMEELRIEDQVYPLSTKQLQNEQISPHVSPKLHRYKWETPWMGLNQKNYRLYRTLSGRDQHDFLEKILRNQLVGFLKEMGASLDTPILVNARLHKVPVQVKNQSMMGFLGSFVCNVELPPLLGIGKFSSRGFGTILPT